MRRGGDLGKNVFARRRGKLIDFYYKAEVKNKRYTCQENSKIFSFLSKFQMKSLHGLR